MNNLINVISDFIPDILAELIDDDFEKQKVKKIGELCRKHDVPFSRYYAIANEYNKWEASR
jgi:hypothetical protein